MMRMFVGVISIAGKQKYNEMRPKDPAKALLYEIKANMAPIVFIVAHIAAPDW